MGYNAMVLTSADEIVSLINKSSKVIRYEKDIYDQPFLPDIRNFLFVELPNLNSREFAQLLKDISDYFGDTDLNVLIQHPNRFDEKSWSGDIGGLCFRSGWNPDDYVCAMEKEPSASDSFALYYWVISMFIFAESLEWAFCVDRDWGLAVFGMPENVTLPSSILNSTLWIDTELANSIVVGNSEGSGIFLDRRNQMLKNYGLTSQTLNGMPLIISTARAIVCEEIDLIQGIRQLSGLGRNLGKEYKALFLPIFALESNAVNFPLGEMRKYCAKDYLKRMDEEMNKYKENSKEHVINICHEIIRRISSET